MFMLYFLLSIFFVHTAYAGLHDEPTELSGQKDTDTQSAKRTAKFTFPDDDFLEKLRSKAKISRTSPEEAKAQKSQESQEKKSTTEPTTEKFAFKALPDRAKETAATTDTTPKTTESIQTLTSLEKWLSDPDLSNSLPKELANHPDAKSLEKLASDIKRKNREITNAEVSVEGAQHNLKGNLRRQTELETFINKVGHFSPKAQQPLFELRKLQENQPNLEISLVQAKEKVAQLNVEKYRLDASRLDKIINIKKQLALVRK